MRGRFFLGATAFVAVFASWSTFILPRLERRLEILLPELASRKAGLTLEFDSIRISPWLFSVRLNGLRVRLANGSRFSCRSWTFNVGVASPSPSSWLFFSIGQSTLDRPEIDWVSEGRPLSLTGLGAFWPRHRLVWTEGRVSVTSAARPRGFETTAVTGQMDLRPGFLRLSAEGQSAAGPWNARSTLQTRPKGADGDVTARFTSVPLAGLEIPGLSGGPARGIFSATFKKLERFDTNVLLNPALVWRWEGRIDEGAWKRAPLDDKIDGVRLRGKWTLTREALSLTNVRLGTGLDVRGGVLNPLSTERRLALTWSGTDVAVAEFRGLFPAVLRKIPLAARLETAGTWEGAWSAPHVTGRATVRDGSFAGIRWPTLEVAGEASSRGTHWKINTWGGAGVLSGTPSTSTAGGWAWEGRGKNFSLGDVARLNGWRDIEGTGSAALAWRGPLRDGLIQAGEGTWTVSGFRWGVGRPTETVRGELTWAGNVLRASSEGDRFFLEGARGASGWDIRRLFYQGEDGLHVESRGRFGGSSGFQDFYTKIDQLPLKNVPPLVKKFPEVTGRLFLEGTWSGRGADAQFSGEMRGEDIRWRAEGPQHRAQLEFHGNAAHARIPRFDWDGRVTGEALWSSGQGWQCSLTFADAEPARVFDFWDPAREWRGSWKGEASLSGSTDPDRKSPLGWGRLDWTDPGRGRWQASRLALDFFIDEQRLSVKKFDVYQDIGVLRGAVDVVRRSRNTWEWDGRLSAESFELLGPWNGTLLAQGSGSPRRWSGTLQSDGVSWRGARSGPLTATLDGSATEIRLTNFQSALGLGAEGRFLSSSESVDAAVWVKGKNWPRIFWDTKRLSDMDAGGWRWGDVDLRAEVQGPVRSPTLTVRGRWDGVGRGVDLFRMEARAAATRERIDVGAVNAWWGDTPLVSAAGSFSLARSTGPIHFNAEGGNLPLGDLVRVFWPGFLGTGSGDYVLSASGTRDAPSWVLSSTATWTDGEAVRWTFRALSDRLVPELWTIADLRGSGPGHRWALAPGATLTTSLRDGIAFQGRADVRNVSVGPFTFFGGLALSGWGLRDIWSGRATARALWVNQKFYDGASLDARGGAGEIQFGAPGPGYAPTVTGRMLFSTGTWRFEDVSVWEGAHRRLTLNGTAARSAWDWELLANDVEAETLVALANLDWPLSGTWDARITARGRPDSPGLVAEVKGRTGHWGALPYDRLSATLKTEGTTLVFDNASISKGNGYTLTGAGRWPWRSPTGQTPRSFAFSGRLTDGNLRLLESLGAGVRKARGSFEGAVTVSSTDGVVSSTGTFELRGRVLNRSYAKDVSDLNVALVMSDGVVSVERGEARVGRGRLVLAGRVLLSGLSLGEYDLSLVSVGDRGVDLEIPLLSVPPGPLLGRLPLLRDTLRGVSRGEPRVRLFLAGPAGEHTVSGQVILDKTYFTYPPSKKSKSMSGVPPWLRRFLRETWWDLELKTGEETWYRNEYVNVEVAGDLRLKGRPRAWNVNGKISAEQGVINYLGQNFTVRRGQFEVESSTRAGLSSGVFPYISGEADKIVAGQDGRGFASDDVVTMVVDRARVGEIQPRFVSRNNPGLKSERVALLALGFRGGDQLSPEDRDQLLRAGLVQLLGASASPLATRLARNFGIDMINTIYEPPPDAGTDVAAPASELPPTNATLADYLRGAGAAARIRFSDRLFGVYKVKVDEAQNQTYFRDEIEFVYRVARSLHLRASTELDSKKLLGAPPNRRLAVENQWRFDFPSRKVRERPSDETLK